MKTTKELLNFWEDQMKLSHTSSNYFFRKSPSHYHMMLLVMNAYKYSENLTVGVQVDEGQRGRRRQRRGGGARDEQPVERGVARAQRRAHRLAGALERRLDPRLQREVEPQGSKTERTHTMKYKRQPTKLLLPLTVLLLWVLIFQEFLI